MSGPISPILWCWAALSPFLFRLLPGRDAAITCLVVGWGFLPVASYPLSTFSSGADLSSVHAVAVPTSSQVNKATAIGLGCLAGLVVFDRRTFERLRLDLVNLPMVAACLIPLASTAANGLPLSEGLAQVRYLALAWGVPYLMGRAYLVDAESRGRFAVGLAAAGLAYLPFCLLEIVEGPICYRIAYGPHPYEFEGALRALGHRPLGFQEHGNQLGMWLASSALAATWLWASGANKKPGGVAGGPLSAALIGATLLCQSHGSIVLLGLALAPLAVARPMKSRLPWRWIISIALGLAFVGIGLLVARKVVAAGSLRLAVGSFFKGLDKASFTWRLARTEEFLPIAWQHPWLGWARADWRGDGLGFVNPVNLSTWLLTLGLYGVLGVAALLTTWLLPLVRTFRLVSFRSWTGPSGGATGALVALVAINFLDTFSNSVVILPIMAAVGGLNRPIGPRRSML